MIRRPPRSTLSSSSAASDVYKRQERLFKENQTDGGLAGNRRTQALSQPLAGRLAGGGARVFHPSGRREHRGVSQSQCQPGGGGWPSAGGRKPGPDAAG